MLVVLSPAKALDMAPVSGPAANLPVTKPELIDDISELTHVAQGLSAGDLMDLMGISEKLAKLNYDRFHEMDVAPRKAAALAFSGDTYKGLEAKSLDEDALTWAQDHVRILSGLYGVLRPLDDMAAYRLEMGTKLANPRGKNLYEFWGPRIAQALNRQAEQVGSDVVVNCASQEYFKAVDEKSLDATVITPNFLDQKGDKPAKTISFYAKQARGAMARFIVENRLVDPAHLEGFDLGGYRFDPERSQPNRPAFLRVHSA